MMHRAALLFFAIWPVLSLAQHQAPVQEQIADDAYAVYSTVLRHPVWDHLDNDRILLIEDTTGETYGGTGEPAQCIHAPAAEQKRLEELLADYAAHKSETWKLAPRFTISRTYRMLTKAEADEFSNFRFRGKKPSGANAKLFRQSEDLIRLGRVFFNSDRTLALVMVSNYCGGLCGGQDWRVLEKRQGAWVTLPWNQCMTVSRGIVPMHDNRGMSHRQNIASGVKWEDIVGYSRAVRVDNRIYLTGTTATAADGTIVGDDDGYAQTVQVIRNIERALQQAGATLENVVRTRMFVTDISRWQEYGRAHREFFGEIRPCATMVEVRALIDPQMLIEIEVEAEL